MTELADVARVSVVLFHPLFEGRVGGIGIPAAVQQDGVAAIFQQVREHIREALGHARVLFELAPKHLGVFEGELWEWSE